MSLEYNKFYDKSGCAENCDIQDNRTNNGMVLQMYEFYMNWRKEIWYLMSRELN